MANLEQLRILKQGPQKWNEWRKTKWNPYHPIDLQKADLHGAELQQTNLYRANLAGADLSEANLRGADLTEADLTETNLSGADLQGAILRTAFCFQTDLRGANLVGADMSGALLAGVNMAEAKMPAVKGLQRPTVPRSEDRSTTEIPAHVGEDLLHIQVSDSTVASDKQVEVQLPQPELGALTKAEHAVEPSGVEIAVEPSSAPKVGKAPIPKVKRRLRLVIRPPEVGKDFIEGERKERLSQYYERDPKLRAAAIALHGTKCMVCGFDFEAFYGVHGAGYIEVHHLRPISSVRSRTKVSPQTDMAVLCANCHRMIHRNRDGTLSLDELRSLLRR